MTGHHLVEALRTLIHASVSARRPLESADRLHSFIEAGDADLGEILAECGDGILLVGSRGGQVDPGRGVFQFNAEYGYLIEGGEKGRMLRDVSLSGEILSTLHGILLCGKERVMHQGFCGKGGQSVPVSDGSPHLLLSEAVVGGSGTD